MKQFEKALKDANIFRKLYHRPVEKMMEKLTQDCDDLFYNILNSNLSNKNEERLIAILVRQDYCPSKLNECLDHQCSDCLRLYIKEYRTNKNDKK